MLGKVLGKVGKILCALRYNYANERHGGVVELANTEDLKAAPPRRR